jgi:hypothetical protein
MRQAMAKANRNRMGRLLRWSLLLLAAALPLAAAQAQGANPDPAAAPGAGVPSEAERLVFLQEHLANTHAPGSLRYLYVEEAQGKPRVDDQAVLRLSAGADGRCCDVHGDYLSGAMAVNLPDIPAARANPVLLYFLESEVRRLQRTTAGQTSHFRRRIRQSLADSARVASTTIQWGGKAVPARIVQVTPFVDDPYRGRFIEQAATEYAFVLSGAVPGGVYQMRAVLPGHQAGAAPLALRTLTMAEQE